MRPSVAIWMCVLFVLWLFARDAKRRKMSAALWIPLTWAFIVGSKPISSWLGLNDQLINADELEGSPFDRNIYLLLIAAGLFVLVRRRATWGSIVKRNAWLFLYFVYLGISVLWSDYSFVAFKRWIKDFGNVVIVLVILAENDPVEATKIVLARCAYLLIPASLLLTRYYWVLGGYYDQWTGQPIYTGVAADKNMFGMTLFVCGLSLIWILTELRKEKPGSVGNTELFTYVGLMLMVVYLFYKAHSSTAIVCTVIGASVFVGMKFPAIRTKVINRLGVYSLVAGFLALLLHAILDLGGTFVQLVGRDLTFTGRTAIWQSLLNEKTNPLFGEGYYSFWTGDRVRRLSEGYYYLLNEAHNGLLETYLNSGLIGLALLFAVLFCAGKRIRQEAAAGEPFAAFRLAFLIAVVFYSATEAVFNRLSLIWFLLLLAIIEYPRRKSGVMARAEEPLASQISASHRTWKTAGGVR